MCCQGKAGQGHRIESIAWYAQTIVYYTIFPNKKQMKRLLKKNLFLRGHWFLFISQFYFILIFFKYVDLIWKHFLN